jgi:iron complex transport system ATP-binding protein
MIQITVKNLAYAYGRKQVLRGISHVFEPGTFTAIMGKNGSGKTTLLHCINKMAAGFTGEIHLGASDVHRLTLEELAQLTAFVPQGQDAVFGASVFETVLLGRLPFMTWAPSETDYQIVDEVLAALQLEHFSTTDIHHISGGERQKVFIARAIAQKTPVILLDEPVTYLDIKHQLEIMTLLQQLAQRGYNIVMVVHDLNLALTFCTHFLFLKNGNVVYGGDQSQIDKALVESVFEVGASTMSDVTGRRLFSFEVKD